MNHVYAENSTNSRGTTRPSDGLNISPIFGLTIKQYNQPMCFLNGGSLSLVNYVGKSDNM